MRERLVGLRHLVHVVALLDDVALALERVDDLGSDGGGGNEPWQLGYARVNDGVIVATGEWFFDVEGAPDRAHEADALGTLQSSFEVWSPGLAGKKLVTHDIPDNSLAFGVPARAVRKIENGPAER